jgi:amidase
MDADMLALPSAQMFPFDAKLHWPKEIAGHKMDTYHRWMEVVIPASLIGLPALSVPAGFGSQGLPMGLQLIGKRGCDVQVLQVGEAYHQATGYPQRYPPNLT